MTSPYTSFLVLLFLFVFLPLSIGGQDNRNVSEARLEFERLTREDGLPSNAITVIFQDQQGMMWFGTQDGLALYDGYTFKVYKNIPNAPRSLCGSNINTIYEDRSGTIWVGTTNGLAQFDRSTETFENYRSELADSLSLLDDYVFSIYEDRQGQFWIGTQAGGLHLMDRETKTFSPYLPDPDYEYGFVSNSIRAIVDDDTQPGILWLGTTLNSNLYTQFDTRDNTFVFLPGGELEKGQAPRKFVYNLLQRSNGEIWFGTARGLDIMRPQQEGFTNLRHDPDDSTSLTSNAIWSIYEDRQALVWVATFNGGLDQWQPAAGSFRHYRHSPGDPKSIASDNINAIYEDRSGILWFGTANEGIYYANRNIRKFEHLKPYVNHQKSLTRKYATDAILLGKNDVLWIGSGFEGLLFYDEATQTYHNFQDAPGNLRLLSQIVIWSLMEDREGVLWVGGNGAGLYRYDHKAGRLSVYKNDPEDPNSLAANYIPGMLESKAGEVWLGTTSGLQQFDRKTELFRTIKLKEEGDENEAVTFVYEDRQQHIWVASSVGLFCLDAEARVVREFSKTPNDLGKLNGKVSHIQEDKLGNIWLATSDGLVKLSFGDVNDLANTTTSSKQYTEADGLPSNVITAVLEDGAGSTAFTPIACKGILFSPP